MYELKKKIGKVFTSKFVGTGPSSFEKRIYLVAVSQRFRNTDIDIILLITLGKRGKKGAKSTPFFMAQQPLV